MVMLAVTAAGTGRRLAASSPPTAAPNSGPSSTFCGRIPSRPPRAPVAAPTSTGPRSVSRPAAHPSGATSAALATIRDHNGGISPGRCWARATASATASPAAPAAAPRPAARAPRWPARAAPATPPMTPAVMTDPVRSAPGARSSAVILKTYRPGRRGGTSALPAYVGGRGLGDLGGQAEKFRVTPGCLPEALVIASGQAAERSELDPHGFPADHPPPQTHGPAVEHHDGVQQVAGRDGVAVEEGGPVGVRDRVLVERWEQVGTARGRVRGLAGAQPVCLAVQFLGGERGPGPLDRRPDLAQGQAGPPPEIPGRRRAVAGEVAGRQLGHRVAGPARIRRPLVEQHARRLLAVERAKADQAGHGQVAEDVAAAAALG